MIAGVTHSPYTTKIPRIRYYTLNIFVPGHYTMSAYIKCPDVQHTTISRRGGSGRLCRVQVNPEQVSLESLMEVVEGLCGPDVGRERVPPPRCRNRETMLLNVINVISCYFLFPPARCHLSLTSSRWCGGLKYSLWWTEAQWGRFHVNRV